MKKRGLSSVLATLLILLMAILGAILIWVYIRSSVTESSERVEMQEKCYALDTELQSCEYGGGGPLGEIYFVTGLIKLKQGDPTELRVAFYAEDGTAVIKDLEPINILETKQILPATRMSKLPVYAIASPIIYNRDKTGSIVCPISKKMVCNEVSIDGDLCEIPTFIEDINPFVAAISGPNNVCADFSCNGLSDFGDINPFMSIIESGWILCNQDMICDYVSSINLPSGQIWLNNQTAIDYLNALCT